jgi:hypothetical protein
MAGIRPDIDRGNHVQYLAFVMMDQGARKRRIIGIGFDDRPFPGW